jgi:peptidoglycan/xylan/chitin deacetylase (PgdA/CDA1 family)
MFSPGGKRPQHVRGFHMPAVRGRSRQSHHRRRRHIALGTFGVVLLVAIVVFSAAAGGGGRARAGGRPAAPTGDFARFRRMAGSGAGSFAGDEMAAENAAIDKTLAYTPLVRVAGSQHREIALTFDDGPGPYTPEILSILSRDHVPATFFEVGVLERYFHASTAEEVARGYPIGDHTFNHQAMSRLSVTDQKTQLLEDSSAIGNYGAPFPRLFRPPYGLWDGATLALLKSYRMLMVLWTVDTSDYKRPGVAAIVRSALAGARPGAIVLLHDAGGQRIETVQALPLIISGLRKRGYRLVTVPRLLLDNPAPVDQVLPAGLVGGGG